MLDDSLTVVLVTYLWGTAARSSGAIHSQEPGCSCLQTSGLLGQRQWTCRTGTARTRLRLHSTQQQQQRQQFPCRYSSIAVQYTLSNCFTHAADMHACTEQPVDLRSYPSNPSDVAITVGCFHAGCKQHNTPAAAQVPAGQRVALRPVRP
jgi:hypothetical protein